MKKLFLPLCLMLILAGCSNPFSNTEKPEGELPISPDENISGNIEQPEIQLPPFDFDENLVGYLYPGNPYIAKHAIQGEYEVFTLDLTSEQPFFTSDPEEQASCDWYGYSDCINVITKNGEIIRHNQTYRDEDEFATRTSEAVGSFYEFTPNGVIFRYLMGEGMPCGRYSDTFKIYYNIPTQGKLYGVYSEWHEGVSPDPEDEFCDNPDTVRTAYTGQNFFDYEKYQQVTAREELEALILPLQSTDMESAFYEYNS